MLTGVLQAIPLKKNLPVALLVTLYTNSFTIVPLYLLACGYAAVQIGWRADVVLAARARRRRRRERRHGA